MELNLGTILNAIQGNTDAIEQVIYSLDKYIDFMILQARIRSGGLLPRFDEDDMKNEMQNSLRSAIPHFQVRI